MPGDSHFGLASRGYFNGSSASFRHRSGQEVHEVLSNPQGQPNAAMKSNLGVVGLVLSGYEKHVLGQKVKHNQDALSPNA